MVYQCLQDGTPVQNMREPPFIPHVASTNATLYVYAFLRGHGLLDLVAELSGNVEGQPVEDRGRLIRLLSVHIFIASSFACVRCVWNFLALPPTKDWRFFCSNSRNAIWKTPNASYACARRGDRLDVNRRLQVADGVGGGEVLGRRAAHRVVVGRPVPELDDL